MTKIILVKHAQTDWEKQNRIQGSLDIPLNFEGKEEARKISEELSGVKLDAVYCSPSSCSRETAEEIAGPRKLKVRKKDVLKELNYNSWEGLLLDEIKKRYAKQYKLWKSSPASGPPGHGESLHQAYDRVVSALHKIADRHKGGNVCLVSHEITIALIKCYLKNIELERLWEIAKPDKKWEEFELGLR